MKKGIYNKFKFNMLTQYAKYGGGMVSSGYV